MSEVAVSKKSNPGADAPRLARIVVHVADLQEATRTYSELLGVPGRAVGGGRAYFDCGAVIFALLDPTAGGVRPKALPESVSFAVRHLEAFQQRARKLGWLDKDEVHGEPAGEIGTRPWGERSFYAVDPWGNSLCFLEEGTLFTGDRALRV